MSYILDALRRADAERERGGVPGLNAQSVELVTDEAPALRRGLPAWAWALLGAAVVAALAAFWLLLRRDDAPPPVRAEAPALPISVPPPPVATPAPAAPPAAPPMAATPPAPAHAGEPPPEASPRRAVPPKPVRRTAQADKRAVPAEGAASVAEIRATPWAELPEEFRRSVPAMSFGGSTYSPNPASRMLIVNGLVQREGDEPAPGVTIKHIRLRSAVLEYRGQRYEVGF
jgi:general secretion pathway protein B